jgi:putative transposase
MPWKPKRLTKKQLEERRQRAAELFHENELSQADIARELQVTTAAVNIWHKAWLSGGAAALKSKPHPGPGKSITPEEQQQLLQAVELGTLHWGFSTEGWTSTRIAQVCKRVTGVDYHPDHIRKLMRALRYSPQKPQKRALERDEAAVSLWLEKTHPELLKKGRRTARRSSTRMKAARV